VLDSLNDADKTREQIAAELGVEPSHAYLSLFRLRRQGLVEKAAGTDGTKTNSWHRVST
jgi:predicted transcriptional regulator